MKKFYSEFQYSKALRRYGLTNLAVLQERLIDHCLDGGMLPESVPGQVCALQGNAWMLSGKGTDYFIESHNLADMLVGMVKDAKGDCLSALLEPGSMAYVIHPLSPYPAILVSIWSGEDGSSGVIINSEAEELSSFCSNRVFEGDLSWWQRLAIGVSLYVRFFPHAVTDGLPADAKHPAHYRRSKCRRIGVAEELIDRSGPRPHIRRAYFRFLGSEFYKAKRGTYVLARECFVRGKARIVVEVEDDGNFPTARAAGE